MSANESIPTQCPLPACKYPEGPCIGWCERTLPPEPTPEMIQAGKDACAEQPFAHLYVEAIYKAMVARASVGGSGA